MSTRAGLLAGIALIVGIACSGPIEQSTVAAPSPAPSQSASESPSPCAERTGRTVEHIIPDVEVGQPSRALVHLPACYPADGPYPTVYLVHGAGLSSDSWVNAPVGTPAVADRLVSDGLVSPLIMVMPVWAGSGDDFARHFGDLVASVDETFQTVADPAARGIGGFSAGGERAARVALTTDVGVAALALWSSTWSPQMRDAVAAGETHTPAVYVDVGEQDGLSRTVPAILESLATAGIDPTVEQHPGGHDLQFVGDRISDWLQWLEGALAVP